MICDVILIQLMIIFVFYYRSLDKASFIMTNHLICIKQKKSSEIEEFVHIISMIYNYILQKGYQSMIFNCILSINDR